MRLATDSSADQWQARYFASGGSSRLVLDQKVDAQLTELSLLAERPQDWVLARVLFAHAHGRLRLEQLSPGLSVGVNRSPVGISLALMNDIGDLAQRQGKPRDLYVCDALIDELGGVRGSDAHIEVEGTAWQEDDASLKVWLPDTLDVAVKALAECWDVTASDVLRNLLFAHLYGRLGYQRAVRAGMWAACRRQPDIDAPAFSRRQTLPGDVPTAAPRTRFVRQHGKSKVAFRLWCPEPMKRRIEEAADRHGLNASQHARVVMVDLILGKCPQFS